MIEFSESKKTHVEFKFGQLNSKRSVHRGIDRVGYDRGKIIRIYHECEVGIEKSVPRITDWHHEACRVMTNGDPRDGFFYPTITRIMDSFSCSPLFFYLKISFQKSLNTLRYNFTRGRHFTITMTSLDDNVCEFQYNQCKLPSRDSLGKIAWVR